MNYLNKLVPIKALLRGIRNTEWGDPFIAYQDAQISKGKLIELIAEKLYKYFKEKDEQNSI